VDQAASGASLVKTGAIAPAATAGTTVPVALVARPEASVFVLQMIASAASIVQEKAAPRESVAMVLTPKAAAEEKLKPPAVSAVLLGSASAGLLGSANAALQESASAVKTAKMAPSAHVTLASAANVASAALETRKPPAVSVALQVSASAPRAARAA